MVTRRNVLIFIFSFFIFFSIVLLKKGTTYAVLEDGSTYPWAVTSALSSFCSTPQPSAQTTWLSLAGNPGATTATLKRGDPLNLSLNVVSDRCFPNQNTGIFWDYFRPAGGVYSISGVPSAQNVSIPQLNNSEFNAIVLNPPNMLTPQFSRDSWNFPIDTSALPSGGGVVNITVDASTWQYSHRDTWGNYVCIMFPPQTIMQTHPLWTSAPNQDVVNICPASPVKLTFQITVLPTPSWSVNVSSSCDIDAGIVTFSASKSGSGSADGVVISRSITMQNPSRSISIPNITLNNGDFPWSQTYAISPAPVPGQSIQAGSISATPSSGGGATSTSPSGSCTSPAKHLKPYLKAYGGEVLSGGGFNVGGTCTVPSPTSPAPIGGFGSVQAFTSQNGSGQYVGSSSQLTVSSLLQVNEFYSNSQAGNTSPKSLTIANTGTAEGNSTYGGGSKNTQCITDYYNTTQDPSISSAITNFGSALTGAPGRKQYTVSGDLTIGTGVIPRNHQIAVYVDGDVFINGNISYQTGASNISELPNLYIIAKGNIYIDNDVTNIDGTFIAQTDGPDVNDKGNIYTCTDSNATLFPAAKLATACDKQLVVNGGLIAQEVRFLRTAGSIDTSTSSVETPSYSNGTGTGAAEVINYTPEVYLAPSPLRNPNATNTNTGSAGAGRYDAIKSLPPIY